MPYPSSTTYPSATTYPGIPASEPLQVELVGAAQSVETMGAAQPVEAQGGILLNTVGG
jgi:hypothetical protein